jgi:4-hydroxy-3-polyprenylbenzoate decarboxylase
MAKRIVVGISGASGVTYGVRMLELLRKTEFETHLIISQAGKLNIEIETSYKPGEVEAMADFTYDHKDMAAALASGSFLTEGMVVIPCTIADVTLKEKRKLVLVVRETPLHIGHLRLMTMAAEMGAHLLPPVPSFYHQPKTIDDIINQTIGKVFDYIGIEHDLFNRWGEPGKTPKTRA